jgi:glutaredoxin
MNKQKLLLEAIKSSRLFNVTSEVPKTYVLGLTHCEHCAQLEEELKSRNINYTFIDAGNNDDFSDKIERITENEYYPMIIIYNGLMVEIYDADFKSLI